MDYQLFKIINDFSRQSDFLDYFFILSAQVLILFLILGVIGISITRAKEWGKELFFDAAIGVFTALFVNWFVPLFYVRPRPFVDHAVSRLIPIDAASKSFPSDHSAVSFAIAMAVFQYDKRWGILFFAMAFLVGLGRIFTGLHYPLDVLVGAFIGIISSFFAKRFLDYLLRSAGH